MCYLAHVFISLFLILGWCISLFLGKWAKPFICLFFLKYPVDVITFIVNSEVLFIGATVVGMLEIKQPQV